jgi:hypothetical protein
MLFHQSSAFAQGFKEMLSGLHLRAEQSENRNDLALFEYETFLRLSNSIHY